MAAPPPPVDGTILRTPSPGLWHQSLSSEIWLAMRTAAQGSSYRPYETPNVTLSGTRLAAPDVVLSTRRSADAGIEWFLRVAPGSQRRPPRATARVAHSRETTAAPSVAASTTSGSPR